MAPHKKRTPVEAYIAAAPKDVQPKLRQLRGAIRSAAPGAIEGIKWRTAAFSYTRILVTFAVFKHHIGFYPTPSAMRAFKKDLAKYKTGMGSVQFPLDKPLPLPLIKKMTAFRVKESKEKDAKWMGA